MTEERVSEKAESYYPTPADLRRGSEIVLKYAVKAQEVLGRSARETGTGAEKVKEVKKTGSTGRASGR